MAGKLTRLMALPLLFGVAASACDEDDGTGPVDESEVTGFWEGTTNSRDTSAVFRFELFLLEEDKDDDDDDDVDDDDDDLEEGEVEGSGTIRGPTSSIAVIVEGTVLFPDISLTLIAERFSDGKQLINFTGEFVGEDLILGKLNGGGFNDEPLRLRRTDPTVFDP